MSEIKAIITGEKESFLVRVILKKIREAGTECSFVPWNVDDINAQWEGTTLVMLYMDGRPSDKVIHFLKDKMADGGSVLIPIGEKNDVNYICDYMPKDIVYKSFIRPVDNDQLAAVVTEIMGKASSGEFKKSILIVDDDPNYLGLVRDWLKTEYKVSMANSGLQAIKWLGKNKADLILLDHEMPVTSGPQVLEMLRNDEETRSIPVMFLTGKSDKKSVMQVVSLKPEGYFLKTIEKDELLEKLAEYFALNR